MIANLFILGLSLGVTQCDGSAILECHDKAPDVLEFLKPAQVDMPIKPEVSFTMEPSKNNIRPGDERTVVLRGLDGENSHFMIQAKDERGELVGTFQHADLSVNVYQCEGNDDTALNVEPAGKRTEYRLKWIAPMSWDKTIDNNQNTTVFNFYWQVKGPKQVGDIAWGTQYKIVKDQDLVYSVPSGSGAPSRSFIALGILQLALVKMTM